MRPLARPQRSVVEPGSQVSYDPDTLMRIKSLELRAKVVVEGFMSGLHRSPYHGFSVEFTDYRAYSPGDDPRYLDWRLLARSDRYYIKRFEDETNLRCHLLVDLSRSMGFGSLEYNKADYARTVAATFAYFLMLQRDAVGLLTFDQKIAEYLPARYRPGHLRRLMLCLERSLGGKSTDVTSALEEIARTVRKRGLVVLISDLLAPVDKLKKNLSYLRSQGHEVVVMRVLDPAELTFKFEQSALFYDVESGRNIYIDPPAARADYLSRFGEHESEIESACRDLGVDFLRVVDDQPLERVLTDFVNSRMESSRRSAHRSSGETAVRQAAVGSSWQGGQK